MKVKILNSIQGENGEHLEAGSIAEVSNEAAAQLIRQGSAREYTAAEQEAEAAAKAAAEAAAKEGKKTK